MQKQMDPAQFTAHNQRMKAHRSHFNAHASTQRSHCTKEQLWTGYSHFPVLPPPTATVCSHFKTVFFHHRQQLNANAERRRWDFDAATAFLQLDRLIDRLREVRDLLRHRVEFGRIASGGGQPGGENWRRCFVSEVATF